MHCLVTLHIYIMYICIVLNGISFCQEYVTFQNVSCFEFEQSVQNAGVQNIYNVFYFKTSSMCIFNAVKKQSGIGFIVDALFGYFAYLHNLYTVVQLHTNFVLIHFETQSIYIVLNGISFCQEYGCLPKC